MSQHPLFNNRGVHLLVDPDRWTVDTLRGALSQMPAQISSIIVGGTYIHSPRFESIMTECRRWNLPVGNMLSTGPLGSMLSPLASFILVPIMIGARSTRFAFEHVVMAAPDLSRLNVPVVSVAYLTLDGGALTSAQFFTQTIPIPRERPEIIKTLSLASRYLGLSGIYLEAGSGARSIVTSQEIAAAIQGAQLPILVGGGIRSPQQLKAVLDAGATGVIVGSVFEETQLFEWMTKEEGGAGR